MSDKTSTTWNLILDLNDKLKKSSINLRFISIKLEPDEFSIIFNKSGPSFPICINLCDSAYPNHYLTIINCIRPFSFDIIKNNSLDAEQIKLLSIYLPYAILPHFAKLNKKIYAITHFAQSLDGRIATKTLDSKWIGNNENLIHAHRMRALLDGILIGSQTLAIDNPQLNVRHVTGNNPIKIIVGGDNLDLKNYKAIDNKSIVFGQNHKTDSIPSTKIKLRKINGSYSPKQILNKLLEYGLYSVYIEGGSYTSSCFLKKGCVDQVQIHISPQIIGSGKAGYNFNGVNNICESIRFRSYRFIPIGNEMMFVGEF